MKVRSNNELVFLINEINPINFLFIYFLSFFGTIFYIKRNRVKNVLCSKFTVIDVDLLFNGNQGEFNAMTANAYDEFRKIIKININIKCLYTIDKSQIDFTNQWILELGKSFESLYHHKEILKLLQKQFYKKRFFSFPPKPINSLILIDSFYEKNKLNYCLIFIYNFLQSIWDNLLRVLIFIKIFCVSYQKNHTLSLLKINYKILWCGINPQELDIADEYNSKFCFLNIRKLIENNLILYIVPSEPDLKSKNILFKNNIPYLNKNDLGKLITNKRKLYILINHVFQIILYKILKFRNSNVYLPNIECLTKGFCEYELCRILEVSKIITSNSEHETAGYKFSFCKSLNVKSIFWQYSGIGIIPINLTKKNEFTLYGGRFTQCLFSSDEVWVWNEKDKNLIQERHLNKNLFSPKFLITGPIMSGDFNRFYFDEKSVSELKNKYLFKSNISSSAKFWITIFDIPSHPLEIRNSVRSPVGKFPIEMQQEFFNDLSNLLEEFEDLGIIFKPKRRKASDRFLVTDQQKRFYNLVSSNSFRPRICHLPHNIDPYIPFALANGVIGAPFTSAVEVADEFNINCLFYDPINMHNIIYPPLDSIEVVYSYIELKRKIHEWILNINLSPNRNITDPQLLFKEKLLEN